MTNLCYFNQYNPLFLSISSFIFTGSLLVPLKRASFVGDEMRMQTCRRTELRQMLGVATIGSYSDVGSQALAEDRHRLVHVFSWHLFPNRLQSDFQLVTCLMLRLEFMVLFPAYCPRCESPVGSNLESLRATQSSQWTRSHSFSFAWRSHTEKGGLSWLKQHNFVIFRYISTKHCDKVYIWLFDSHVQFMQKFALTAEISTKVAGGGGYFFVFTRYINVPNFVKIEPPSAELWRHIHFSRWRPAAILDSSG